MNINIEKIANGYILTVDGVKTFCDVPEAICGTMAELILSYCKELEAKKSDTDQVKRQQIAQVRGQLAKYGVGVAKDASLTPLWSPTD